MKKLFTYFTILFVIIAMNVPAQDFSEGFILKKEKNSYSGKTGSNYLDATRKEHYPNPKDEKGQNLELMGAKINSIEKLNQIELKIFSQEEIKYLGINNSVADCVISSSGKIVSVSFVFTGWEPKVSVTKLKEYASQIKENITIELSFNKKLVQEGYIVQSIRIFRQLIQPKTVKHMAGN